MQRDTSDSPIIRYHTNNNYLKYLVLYRKISKYLDSPLDIVNWSASVIWLHHLAHYIRQFDNDNAFHLDYV